MHTQTQNTGQDYPKSGTPEGGSEYLIMREDSTSFSLIIRQKYPYLQNNLKINLKMTIKEAQKTVDKWITTTGVRYFSELTNMAILTEEVGEVARIMARKYGEQSFKDLEKDIDLADEFADVLFVLICLANQTGVDLTDALKKNLEKKNKRDGKRHLENKKLHRQD